MLVAEFVAVVHEVYGETEYSTEYDVIALTPGLVGTPQYTRTMPLPGVPFGVNGALGFPFS